MSVIDEVKQRTDIVEIIGQYATLNKAGRTFRALCPFHSEKRPSFFVYPEQQSWHCFGACNTGGDVFSFIMKRENIDFGEALRQLAEKTGVSIPSRFEPASGKDEREKLHQLNEAAAQYFHNLLLNSTAAEKARNYLAGRGVLPKTITDLQLGFSLNSWEALKQYLVEKGHTENELLEAGLIVAAEDGKTHDRFRNRLLFPISDGKGRTIGFGGRVLDESLPKYLNSPQTPVFDKSGSLYGLNLATPAIRQQEQVVIVEGYMDVITARQGGFTNVVAAMGTSVTDRQLGILKRLTGNMVLALDADAAGEEAMLRCVGYENSLNAEVRVIVLPGGKDPDDVIREDTQAWQNLLDKALPVVDYTINMVTAKLDLSAPKDKSLAASELLPIIAEMKDDIRKDHYLTKLSKLTGTSYHTLEVALSKIKPSRRATGPKPEAVVRALQPLRSSPLEEYCLALLLKHPELKVRSDELPSEYFASSQNREIYTAWQQASDPPSLRDSLDNMVWEHLDALINKEIPANQIEQRYTDCVLNLRKKYLQDREAKKAEVLTLEREVGGTAAELAKLKEQGIEAITQLGEVFTEKGRRGPAQRR